jgi:hypothetical protein
MSAPPSPEISLHCLTTLWDKVRVESFRFMFRTAGSSSSMQPTRPPENDLYRCRVFELSQCKGAEAEFRIVNVILMPHVDSSHLRMPLLVQENDGRYIELRTGLTNAEI